MQALAEPGSLENAVAKAAFERINEFVRDLQLAESVAEIAHQACLQLLYTVTYKLQCLSFRIHLAVMLLC